MSYTQCDSSVVIPLERYNELIKYEKEMCKFLSATEAGEDVSIVQISYNRFYDSRKNVVYTKNNDTKELYAEIEKWVSKTDYCISELSKMEKWGKKIFGFVLVNKKELNILIENLRNSK